MLNARKISSNVYAISSLDQMVVPLDWWPDLSPKKETTVSRVNDMLVW